MTARTPMARPVGRMDAPRKPTRRDPVGPRPGFVRLEVVGEDWRLYAACRGRDPETWFPIGEAESGPVGAQIREATGVCFGECPVREACLRWAVESGSTDGIFGGLTARQRAVLARSAVKDVKRPASSVPGPRGRPDSPTDARGRFVAADGGAS
jgi:WhiB family transcriptional regulator, redox-sensing transcriptional regulator